MAHCLLARLFLPWLLLINPLVFCGSSYSQVVWSGYTRSFTKPSFSDASLPQNQDVLTASVKLSRGSSGGLINIAAESFYDQTVSPTLTKWATDLNNAGKTIAATNHGDLAFTDWIDAFGGSHTTGSFIEGRNAVVWLTADNIYLDLRFNVYTAGVGGGFSYVRAEPAAAVAGDYNGNGTVDAADYVVWRNALGQSVSPNGAGADGNSNGQIDAGDYSYWAEHFGNPTAAARAGAAAAVPEPSLGIVTLTAAGLLCGATFRRRRWQQSPSWAAPPAAGNLWVDQLTTCNLNP